MIKLICQYIISHIILFSLFCVIFHFYDCAVFQLFLAYEALDILIPISILTSSLVISVFRLTLLQPHSFLIFHIARHGHASGLWCCLLPVAAKHFYYISIAFISSSSSNIFSNTKFSIKSTLVTPFKLQAILPLPSGQR